MKQFRLLLLGGFILAALALLLFGPRDPDPPFHKAVGRWVRTALGNEPREPEPIIVTYWEKWTGNEAAQMQQIVDKFNSTVGKEKGIKVKYLSISTINEKTLIATAAGVPPDIAGVWDGQVPQFGALGALEPLDAMAAAASPAITEGYYKPVYWKGCQYDGRLYALISTPAAVALHYNKKVFQENAKALRDAGLDPDRAPQTLDELNRYADVLDIVERDKNGAVESIKRAGYLPMEPGWFINYTCYWFGGSLYNEKTRKFTLTDPEVVQTYEWIRSYSLKLGGRKSTTTFRSGLGGFNSPLNPFMVEPSKVVMEQQGPWMANFIEDIKPKMNGHTMSRDEEMKLLRDGKLTQEDRKKYSEWGAAPFPGANGLKDATFAGFDVFVIPKGAKHKKEAFEFMAYVNRQDIMEELCSMHCKNSPLAKVSDGFIKFHPNAYIDVFERLAASPNAKGIPAIPIWPEVASELGFAGEKVYLLSQEPKAALEEAQLRLQKKLDDYFKIQALRQAGEKKQ